MRSPTRRDLVALVSASCLFLAALEYLIPKPLPFFRLGLANLPVLLSLVLLRKRDFAVVVAAKIVGQGFVNGTLFSYVFLLSAAGSLSAALVMVAVHAVFGRWISLVGISVLGAAASNVAQLALAGLLVFGRSALYIAPPFLAVGVVSGTILGFIAEYYLSKSQWPERVRALAHAGEVPQ